MGGNRRQQLFIVIIDLNIFIVRQITDRQFDIDLIQNALPRL